MMSCTPTMMMRRTAVEVPVPVAAVASQAVEARAPAALALQALQAHLPPAAFSASTVQPSTASCSRQLQPGLK